MRSAIRMKQSSMVLLGTTPQKKRTSSFGVDADSFSAAADESETASGNATERSSSGAVDAVDDTNCTCDETDGDSSTAPFVPSSRSAPSGAAHVLGGGGLAACGVHDEPPAAWAGCSSPRLGRSAAAMTTIATDDLHGPPCSPPRGARGDSRAQGASDPTSPFNMDFLARRAEGGGF